MEKTYVIRDCNKCEYLQNTEDQQSKNKEPHICTKQNKKVYHRGRHPILPAFLNDCPLVNIIEKDYSERTVKSFDLEYGENDGI